MPLSGSVTKQSNKVLSGETGSLSGIISKAITVLFSGVIVSLSGIVSSIRELYIVLTGAWGGFTGSVSNLIGLAAINLRYFRTSTTITRSLSKTSKIIQNIRTGISTTTTIRREGKR